MSQCFQQTLPYFLWSHVFSETNIILSNNDIIFHTVIFDFHLLHACSSDSYIFSAFWKSSLTVASPIWPFLQSTCLDLCLSPMNSKFFLFVIEDQHHSAITSLMRLVRMTIRQCFFPQNMLPFFFFPLVKIAVLPPVRKKLNVVTLETIKI